jgi:phenylpropionate dioxygenase-like ring-hydroxylating dioxygenase large terminal subunit
MYLSVAEMSAGKDLVLWRDGAGEWRCFADKCAHRNAPLSEGRIEPQNGSIMCSYHGARCGTTYGPAS